MFDKICGKFDIEKSLSYFKYFGFYLSINFYDIDIEAGFCSDRGPTSLSWTIAGFNYAAYDRIVNNRIASLDCSAEDILSKDNGRLDNPVGLIIVDELAYAGLVWNSRNTSFYLYTGQSFLTMSPSNFSGSGASVFRVRSSGNLYGTYVYSANGVRPVINLKADTVFQEGTTGTSSNPYVVV